MYEEYISKFPITECKKNHGTHLHHVVPIAVQIREKGVDMSRREFINSDVCDNRCVELSVKEHILAHYYYCVDHPNDIEELFALKMLTDSKLNLSSLSEEEMTMVLSSIDENLLSEEKRKSAILMWENPKYREAHRKAMEEVYSRDNISLKKSESMKSVYEQTDLRKRISESSKEMWLDDNYRNKMISIRNSDEFKAKNSEHSIELWSDDKMREKIISRMNSDEVHSHRVLSCKQYWDNDEVRKVASEKRKLLWESDEYRNKIQKGISQYTVEGELVRSYSSVKEASELTGFSLPSISNHLNGRSKSCHGYIFRYID